MQPHIYSFVFLFHASEMKNVVTVDPTTDGSNQRTRQVHFHLYY